MTASFFTLDQIGTSAVSAAMRYMGLPVEYDLDADNCLIAEIMIEGKPERFRVAVTHADVVESDSDD